jgi:hypothetical protein
VSLTLLLPVELRRVNHVASTNAEDSNLPLGQNRPLQVPAAASFRESVGDVSHFESWGLRDEEKARDCGAGTTQEALTDLA